VKLTLDELLSVVYRFYPREITPEDPGYKDTEEHRRLADARRRSGAEGNPWRVLLDRFSKRVPGVSIHNGSLHLFTGGWDAGYVGALILPTRGPHETHHQVSFLVSFLVPCYVVSSLVIAVAPTTKSSGLAGYTQFTFTPDEEPYARIVTEEILAVFPGYEPMPPEIGNIIVPDVVAGTKPMGKTTLFHCLFTDVWG
jgi:hypothetical protein